MLLVITWVSRVGVICKGGSFSVGRRIARLLLPNLTACDEQPLYDCNCQHVPPAGQFVGADLAGSSSMCCSPGAAAAQALQLASGLC
jgi:hypothetical protein